MAKRSAGEQAAEDLKGGLLTRLRPGDRLPSEEELTGVLGVSRASVREALALLAAEGLVMRRWGIGTFFVGTKPRVAHGISSVDGGLPDILASAGGRPSVAYFDYRRAPADPERLPDTPATPRWIIERVFALDEVPVVHLVDHVPQTLFGKRVDPRPLANIDRRMREVLALAGVDFARLALEAWAEVADQQRSQRLELTDGEAVLRTQGRGFDGHGHCVLFADASYRTSKIRLALSASAEPVADLTNGQTA